MIREISKNSLRFFLLIIFQVLVLNNVGLSQYLNPYIYILFLLWLPMTLPPWLMLSICFLTGLSIDMFSNSPGIHASACVVLGFVRPAVVNLLTPRNSYQSDDQPRIGYMGFSWFLTYATVLTVLHHLTYFMLEAFSFELMFFALQKAFCSSFLTLLLILIVEFFFYASSKKTR